MAKCINDFLTGITIQKTVAGTFSSKKSPEEGLPKGSDLSCTLFLIFMNDEDLHGLFADDLAIWTTEKYPILARAKI